MTKSLELEESVLGVKETATDDADTCTALP
jgi:hypothetical protein